MEEIWKPIPGHPDYEASTLGKIRRISTGSIEILEDMEPGYVSIDMGSMGYRNCKRCILISNTFMTRPTGKVKMHFKDGDEFNCAVSNMEWASIDSRIKIVRQYDLNGNFVREYVGARKASDITGVSYQGILLCCNHRQASAGNYKWCYKGDEINPDKIATDYPLKPCPRCGGKSEIAIYAYDKLARIDPGRVSSRRDYQYTAECTECHIQTARYDTPQDAMKDWNENRPENKIDIMSILNS